MMMYVKRVRLFCVGWFINVWIAALVALTPTAAVNDIRRPIWNVAHMVNAAYQVDYYLDEGANSIEFDIAFNNDGEATFTYHGVPCDCFRTCTRYERFVPYLQYVRKITTPNDPNYRKQLSFLFMDLKISSLSGRTLHRAGVDIATKLLQHYWQNGNSGAVAKVLLSMPSIDNYAFIEGFKSYLTKQGFAQYMEKIGYDFSGNENLDSIKASYKRLNIDKNIWQGDGITNCLPRSTKRLREALWRRDQPGNNHIDKVYWWTVDKMSSMRSVLRLGVDGVITNYPDRLVRVLKEGEFSGKFRMATIDDNPFTKFQPSMSTRMFEDIVDKSHMTARGGNISDFANIKYDDEEILDNSDRPDEEHWQREIDPYPHPHLLSFK